MTSVIVAGATRDEWSKSTDGSEFLKESSSVIRENVRFKMSFKVLVTISIRWCNVIVNNLISTSCGCGRTNCT